MSTFYLFTYSSTNTSMYLSICLSTMCLSIYPATIHISSYYGKVSKGPANVKPSMNLPLNLVSSYASIYVSIWSICVSRTSDWLAHWSVHLSVQSLHVFMYSPNLTYPPNQDYLSIYASSSCAYWYYVKKNCSQPTYISLSSSCKRFLGSIKSVSSPFWQNRVGLPQCGARQRSRMSPLPAGHRMPQVTPGSKTFKNILRNQNTHLNLYTWNVCLNDMFKCIPFQLLSVGPSFMVL